MVDTLACTRRARHGRLCSCTHAHSIQICLSEWTDLYTWRREMPDSASRRRATASARMPGQHGALERCIEATAYVSARPPQPARDPGPEIRGRGPHEQEIGR